MRTHEIVIFVPLLAHALHLAASEVLLLLTGLLAVLKLRFKLSVYISRQPHKLVVDRHLSALGFGYERTVLALKPLHVFDCLALLRLEQPVLLACFVVVFEGHYELEELNL